MYHGCTIEKLWTQLLNKEVGMILKMLRYLGQQGYSTEKIVFLTSYLGFTDNYQGEESEIVIVSLTRSNPDHEISFNDITRTSADRCHALRQPPPSCFICCFDLICGCPIVLSMAHLSPSPCPLPLSQSFATRLSLSSRAVAVVSTWCRRLGHFVSSWLLSPLSPSLAFVLSLIAVVSVCCCYLHLMSSSWSLAVVSSCCHLCCCCLLSPLSCLLAYFFSRLSCLP